MEPLLLSTFGGVAVVVAYMNRDKPDWLRQIRGTYGLAIGLIIVGAVVWLIRNFGPS